MSELPTPTPPFGLEADLLAPGLIHEMRHPLSGIKAGLQLIAGALGERVTGLDEWDLVASQVRRLEDTLQTFQELAEPRPGSAIPFAVEPVVRDALSLLRFRSRRLGDRFALVVEGPVPLAHGSPRALLHALTNLAVNALDAVEAAGRPGRVEVRLLRDPAAARPQVRVADEGTGLSPEVARRLFEPRFTTKAPGKGSGLGLSIARRLLAASGGVVRLVAPGEPGRRPWASAEFAIDLAAHREAP
jgi:signal transduction histidine kinase